MKKSKFGTAFIYFQIIASAVLLAFTYQLFIVENDFAPAGINGIATMVQYKTGFSIAYMSLLVNIPLCIFAYFLIDKGFAKRSLCFCLVYSLTFLALQRLGLEAFQYDAQEITEEVVNKLKHSTTVLSGEGGFSHSKMDVLICVVNKHQLVEFKDIIRKYGNTFSFSEAVGETYGNFKHIR